MKRLSPSRSFVALLTALSLHACGLASHGGIVDNGNKPSDPTPGKTTNPGPSTTAQKTTPVPVMTQFQVAVPSQWPVDEMLESNILSFNGHRIFFAEGKGICPVEPVVNQFDIKIYACSDTMTIFDVGYDDFIVAKHAARTEEIDLVLYSLRRL